MANLEIQIGGDNSDFKKKIQEVEHDLKLLSNEKLDRIRLGLDTKEIDGNIKDVKNHLSGLKTSLKEAGGSFDAIKPKVANGGNALMQFSRIAQDAPFGIMGIGNNITATAEAFSHLKNQTGSTGAALKSVASSMIGSGGILLAVSLVTSGLTYMSQSGLSVGDVFDKLSGNFDNLKKSMQDLASEALKNSSAEISSMNALVSVAQSDIYTRKERSAAVQKLQEQYPAYFGNLSREQILNGDVESAVRGVTQAIIAKAKATALSSKIAENELAILKLQQEGQKNFADYTAGKGVYAVLKGATAQQALKLSADATSKSIDKLTSEQALLTSELEKSTAAAVNFEMANKKATADSKIKKPKTYDTPQVSAVSSIMPELELVNLNHIETFIGKMDQYGNKIRQLPTVITTSFKGISTPVSSELLKMQEIMFNFSKNIDAIISDTISSTFMGLGAVIGEAIASGGNVLESAGNSLLASLGGLLSAMGGELIKLGTAAVLAGTVTQTFGSIAGIGAGIAAIAGGTILSAVGSAMASKSNKAVSGYDGQGGGLSRANTGASYSSPSSSSNYGSSSSTGWGSVVFEISGYKLLGVLKNAMNSNSKLGGDLSFT